MNNALSQQNSSPLEQDAPVSELVLGQWYWVKSSRWVSDPHTGEKAEEPEDWLGCAMHIGSNFVEIQSPRDPRGGCHSVRVHFDEFWSKLRHEPDAEGVIQSRINFFQGEATRLLGAVQSVTAELGVSPGTALPSSQETGTALITLSGQRDIAAYSLALETAKNTTLPDLFSAIEKNNLSLSQWLTARTLPLLAQTGQMKATIGEVSDRIFSVGLYAGLTEQVVQCCEGAPAGRDAKLHVMQRRCYMDEECLANYNSGGMEFKNIGEFDQWISLPENRDRILPFPRTMVAMRVRRRNKQRDWDGTLLGAFIQMSLADSDKYTYLYIRNGDQVWRMNCALDFGELIFPDKSMFDPAESTMVKMFGNWVDKMMTTREYDFLHERYLAESTRLSVALQEWRAQHPAEPVFCSPFYVSPTGVLKVEGVYFNPSEWQPFDPSNVYFDECLKEVSARVKEYNRIAIIIQGLFDRSPVLQPHPPVQSWTPQGFEDAIVLVYDGTQVLTYGDTPDFGAYHAMCNATLDVGSIVTGQEDYWLRREAEKENRRRDADYRDPGSHRPLRFKPYGNEGPGRVARITAWKPRAHTATFTWDREKRSGPDRWSGTVSTSLVVPAAELFNISGYTPGDYKMFFRDVRTREQYLKWAPFLLTAEDYYAGQQRAQPL